LKVQRLDVSTVHGQVLTERVATDVLNNTLANFVQEESQTDLAVVFVFTVA
jgi:hypothetical protein